MAISKQLENTEHLNPLQRPTHTLTPSSINTQNRSTHRIGQHTELVKKLHMDLSWHALNSTLQAKTCYHTEKQGFGYPWLSKKNSRHTHQNPLKLSPVSERSAYPLENYACFSPAHLWVREFWPQIYSLILD